MQDEKVRLAAFGWLKEQWLVYGDVLPRTVLEEGFILEGERVTLIGKMGIWKPRVLDTYPISITTSPESPYNDSISPDNLIAYAYRGDNPDYWDNVALREAMRDGIPLIYFRGLVTGKYFAVWPVYVVHDDPTHLMFTVAVDDRAVMEQMGQVERNEQDALIRRRYITTTVQTRVHRQAFREVVIGAYRQRCALCNLHHPELLDASHIIPDSDRLEERYRRFKQAG